MPVILLGGNAPGPDSVAGLQGWWKADAAAYHTTGPDVLALDTETVVKWGDQSGNNRHFVTGTAPTWRSGIVNGLPVLRFVSGSSQQLVTTGFALSLFITASAYTAFMVMKKTTTGATDGHWYADDNIASQNAISGSSDAADDFLVRNYDGTADTVTKAASLASGFHILTAAHSGGNILAGVDDTRTASLQSAASGDTSVLTQVLTVGRDRGAFGSFDCAEFIIYNAALTEAERQVVERYLAAKYGITLPY